MERAQEVLFQDLKNDSAMGKEVEVISDPDSTTNKGDPNHRDNENNEGQLLLAYQETSQQQGKNEKLLLAYRETSQQQKKKRKPTARLPRDESGWAVTCWLGSGIIHGVGFQRGIGICDRQTTHQDSTRICFD